MRQNAQALLAMDRDVRAGTIFITRMFKTSENSRGPSGHLILKTSSLGCNPHDPREKFRNMLSALWIA